MDMILGSKEFYIFNQNQDNQVSPKTTDSEILQESSEQLKSVLREAYIEYRVILTAWHENGPEIARILFFCLEMTQKSAKNHSKITPKILKNYFYNYPPFRPLKPTFQ